MLVTQAEFARRRGVSRQAVNQMIKMGRLRAVGTKIELTGADEHVWENTDLSQMRLVPDEPAPAPAEPTEKPKRVRAPRKERVPQGVRSGIETFAAARAEHFGLQSHMKRIELAKIAGELVVRPALHSALVAAAMSMRERLDILSSRLATVIAESPDPQTLEALLEEEIEQALDELTDYLEGVVPA